MNKMGFCITGSFCSMDDMLDVLKEVINDYDVEVFISPHVNKMDTRFYPCEELKKEIMDITHKPIHTSIQEAEIYGPKKKLDIVLVYPCDGNTLAKLVSGINDNVITMLVKSSLRNQVPIVLGVYSNDILSNSGNNLLTLMNMKHYFIVPMYQDHYLKKPNSVIACKNKVKDTLTCALENKQYQPFLLGYKEVIQ